MKKSQDQRILDYLLSGGKLTKLDALKRFNCLALSSAISRLNKLERVRIKSEFVKVKSGKVLSRYSIPL